MRRDIYCFLGNNCFCIYTSFRSERIKLMEIRMEKIDKIILIILLAILAVAVLEFIFCSPAKASGINDYAPPHPWDKVSHAATAATGTAVGAYLLNEYTSLKPWQSRLIASSASFMMVGVGKELYDKNFDVNDMAASGAGAIIGLGFTWEF